MRPPSGSVRRTSRAAREPAGQAKSIWRARRRQTLTIEKSGPAEIQVGKPATFIILVRNTGQAAAQGVEVHDVIPQGTQLVSTAPPAKRGPQGELVWDLGTVQSGVRNEARSAAHADRRRRDRQRGHVTLSRRASVRTTATRPQLALDVAAPPRVMIGSERDS